MIMTYSGYLLRVPIKRVQKSILETLFKSIQSTNKSPVPTNDYDGLKPTTVEYIRRIQCASDLCETLVKVDRREMKENNRERVLF